MRVIAGEGEQLGIMSGRDALQLAQERQRTEEALSATERMATQLTEQLETLRRETAAIRQRTTVAAAADEKQLDAWLQQLENRPPQADDAHFFRCAADEP